MRRQTELQRQIAEDAAQPYVWADVRVQHVNGWVIEFVLGNSGSTAATDVRVSVTPPFPSKPPLLFAEALPKLERGTLYLAPQREMSWGIGPSPELVNREGDLTHRIRIDCAGPYGPVPTNEFVLDFGALRESVAVNTGSLREVAKSIDAVAKRLPE